MSSVLVRSTTLYPSLLYPHRHGQPFNHVPVILAIHVGNNITEQGRVEEQAPVIDLKRWLLLWTRSRPEGNPLPSLRSIFCFVWLSKKWPNLVPATSEEGQRQDSLITNTCQISISQISVRVDLIWVSSLKEFHSSHRHLMNNHFGSNVLSLLVVFLSFSFFLSPSPWIYCSIWNQKHLKLEKK